MKKIFYCLTLLFLLILGCAKNPQALQACTVDSDCPSGMICYNNLCFAQQPENDSGFLCDNECVPGQSECESGGSGLSKRERGCIIDDNGCDRWGDYLDCSEYQVCQNGSCACTDVCELGNSICGEAGTILVCVSDENGCGYLQDSENTCGVDEFGQDRACYNIGDLFKGNAYHACCENICKEGDARCGIGSLKLTCGLDVRACYDYEYQGEDCGSAFGQPNACYEEIDPAGGISPQCCDNHCNNEAWVCLSEVRFQKCVPDQKGCYQEAEQDCPPAFLCQNDLSLCASPKWQINQVTPGDPVRPQVAILDDSRFAVVWLKQTDPISPEKYTVIGRIWNSQGETISSEIILNPGESAIDQTPQLGRIDDNRFFVLWGSQIESTARIQGRGLDFSGEPVSSQFQVPPAGTESQYAPQLTQVNDWKWLVIWSSLQPGESGNGIHGAFLNTSGEVLSSSFSLAISMTHILGYPRVAVINSNQYLLAWDSDGADGYQQGILGVVINSQGGLISSEFQINQITTGIQAYPKIARLNETRLAIVWVSTEPAAEKFSLRGTVITSRGEPLCSEFLISPASSGNQAYDQTTAQAHFDLVSIDESNFLLVWSAFNMEVSESGLWGLKFNSQGDPMLSSFPIEALTAGLKLYPGIASRQHGFVVAWIAFPPSSDFAPELFARIFWRY